MNTRSDTAPPPIQKYPWARQVIAIAVILFLLLGGLEMGARTLTRQSANPTLYRITQDYGRLASRGPDWIRFVPDEELAYRLRPEFELNASQGGGKTIHNSEGFREEAPFPPKDGDTLRICCYGGSTTYGVGVESNNDTYPAQLEQTLWGAARGQGWERIEVFNLGVGGYTSREILGTMKRTIPLLKPDVVLIQNAINDVIPRFYPEFQADYSHFRTPFTPLTVSHWHKLLYRSHAWLTMAHGLGWIRPLSLQSQTQRPMPPVDEALVNLDANPTTAFEDNLRAEVALARESGAQVWLLTQPYLDVPDFAGPDADSRKLEGGYRKGLAQHTEVVVRLSKEMNTGLVPLHESMPRERAFYSDPIHMSAAGNQRKAALIADSMGPTLPKHPAPAN